MSGACSTTLRGGMSAVCNITKWCLQHMLYFYSTRAFWKPCSMPYASSSKWRSPDADREIKRKMEHQSEKASADIEQMFTGMLTLFGPYLWRCHPPVKWVTEEGRRKREGGREGDEWKRRKRESGTVGRTKWKCWQSGCSMAGKWDSHTAVFLRWGTPEIVVTVFHCQREERERNTRDRMKREKKKDWGETESN